MKPTRNAWGNLLKGRPPGPRYTEGRATFPTEGQLRAWGASRSWKGQVLDSEGGVVHETDKWFSKPEDAINAVRGL